MTETTVFPLDPLGVLAIDGPDAATFLQGQATCDLRQVTPARGALGALCNLQGRMIVSFYLLATDDGLALLMPRDRVQPVLQHLKKYAVFSQVTLADASDRWCVIGAPAGDGEPFSVRDAEGLPLMILRGGRGIGLQRAEKAIAGMAGSLRERDGDVRERNGEVRGRDGEARGRDGEVRGRDGEVRGRDGEVRGRDSDVREHRSEMQEPCSEDAMRPITAAGWQARAIAAGECLVDSANADRFLPQALNYDVIDGVSFKKGCYTGQEVIARMHFKGRMKERLHVASAAATTAPAANTAVVDADGRTVGEVVAAIAIDGKCLVAAVIRHEAVRAGNLHLADTGGPTLLIGTQPVVFDRGE